MDRYDESYDQSYDQNSQRDGYQQSIRPGPQRADSNLRRKSLLIGINYEGQECALQGCRQDAMNMVSTSFLIPPFVVSMLTGGIMLGSHDFSLRGDIRQINVAWSS